MAVKKVTKTVESKTDVRITLEERQKMIDKLSEAAIKNGYGLVGRIDENKELTERLKLGFYPTPSRDFNIATGGGIPIGKVHIMAGDPDSGKTSLALATIAYNQKINPDFYAMWCETESSITDKAIEFFGIDKSRFLMCYVDKASGAEGVIDLIKNYANAHMSMIVVNSLKMLIPKSEQDKPMSKIEVAAQARMNSRMMQKVSGICDEKGCSLVLVQHVITDIGGYAAMGVPMTISGGRGIRFAAMLITQQKKVSLTDKDPIKREDGIKIRVSVKKNHCIWGRNPYVATDYFVEYKTGIEQTLSTLNQLIDAGLLESKGAWIKRYDNNGQEMLDFKWNGKTAFKEDMEAHPEKLQELIELLSNYDTSVSLSEEEINAIKAEEEEDNAYMEELLKDESADVV